MFLCHVFNYCLYSPISQTLGFAHTIKKMTDLTSSTVLQQHLLFSLLFDMNKEPFQGNAITRGVSQDTLRYSVVTDAISASIQHDRLKTEYEIKYESTKAFIRTTTTPYVTDLVELFRGDMEPNETTTYVAMDPGLKDIINTVGVKVERDADGVGYTIRESKTFHVSSQSQRVDRNSKEFNRKRKKRERKVHVKFNADGDHAGKMSVKRLDQWFGIMTNNEVRIHHPLVDGEEQQPDTVMKVNKGTKTVIIAEWLTVMEYKLLHIDSIRKFKEEKIHRIQSLLRFSAKQRAEADMIRRFSEKVGSPLNTIIFFGDGSSAFFASLRGHDYSIKGVGTIKLFQRAGYRVYLVNEAYTSKR
jgi:hypothetical protein